VASCREATTAVTAQEMNGDDPRSPPRAPSRVSAAQLKALKRFGAVQVLFLSATLLPHWCLLREGNHACVLACLPVMAACRETVNNKRRI